MERINELSEREQEVVELLMQGKGNKQIASILDISERTVEFHLTNIYVKFLVCSRVELILLLGKSTGRVENLQPGESTVENPAERVQYKGQHQPITRLNAFCKTSNSDDYGKRTGNPFNLRLIIRMMAVVLFSGFFWTALLSIFLGKAIP